MVYTSFTTSSEQELRNFIAALPHIHYVYVLRRPTGEAFYVGKGQHLRCLNHHAEARNTARLSYKLNIIRKTAGLGEPIIYEIESVFPTQVEAFQRERALIASFGRYDLGRGPVANCTDGGEGACNLSEASKKASRHKNAGVDGNDDWAEINRAFRRLMPVTGAVPIKPTHGLKIDILAPHPSPRAVTLRQGAALVLAAIFSGVTLRSGCRIPRYVCIGGIPSVIENGVGKDILKSGLAMLSPESLPRNEVLLLADSSVRHLQRLFGDRRLIAEGVLDAPQS